MLHQAKQDARRGGAVPRFFLVLLCVGGSFVGAYFLVPSLIPLTYESVPHTASPAKEKEIKRVVTHLPTPEPLKAIYMTSYVAGHKDLRSALMKLIQETELNAVVIDIKDYSGRIAFPVNDPELHSVGASEKRIADLDDFLEELHRKGIYIIGRISVFQDSFLVGKRPAWAVKRESDKTVVWKDYKGVQWLDAGNHEVWEYIVRLAKESYTRGFDELNFDYIRFPSDGNMNDIFYPMSEGRVKAEVIREFFSYLRESLAGTSAILSADLFGMTTTNKDDLNIGQILEYALPYFDYISPMVYPSHYPATFLGFANPAANPYEVVKYSMDEAYRRASTTPLKLRPWLQDFDIGADYDAEKVRAQMKAVYDAGLTSWMLWAPSNRYTKDALLPE